MGRNVEIPHNFGQAELARKLKELEIRIAEAKHIIQMTRLRLKDYLREMQKISSKKEINEANPVSLLEVYKVFLQKEKILYSNLNKFKTEDKLFLGFCWIPKADNENILRQVREFKDRDINVEIPTLKVVPDHGVRPPSLFRQNEVTWVFQEIVDTYGIPTYKEVNPSVFAIVTFPFLFGIMFGDIGHGFVLFLIGSSLCLLSDFIRTRAPAMEPLLGMRYIFLLMGLFATFAGLIYNDFMAIPLWIWDSCYEIKEIHNE